MDLSKLSDSDLEALAGGHMEKLSDEGLSHLAEKPEPSTGDKLKQIMFGGGKVAIPDANGGPDHMQEVVQGSMPLMVPEAEAPAALSGIAKLIGKNALTRTAGGAAQGAGTQMLTNAENQKPVGEGVGMAAALGGGLNAAGEAVAALPGVGKYFSKKMARMSGPQADAYVQDPKGVGAMAKQLDDPSQMPALQDQAKGAIDQSRAILKSKGLGNAQKLRELLAGKNVSLNANDLSGISPDIDSALASRAPQASEYTRPKNIDLDANTANDIKRSLQQQASYQPGTVLDPVQAAKNAELGSKAAQVRQSIESAGGPEVSNLNKQMQEGVLLQQALRRGAKSSPLAFVSSESPDRIAMLARAEQNGAGGMLDFGNKLGAAKTMQQKDVGSGVPTFIGKMAGRLGLRLSNAAQTPAKVLAAPGENPLARQLLLDKLLSPEDK